MLRHGFCNLAIIVALVFGGRIHHLTKGEVKPGILR